MSFKLTHVYPTAYGSWGNWNDISNQATILINIILQQWKRARWFIFTVLESELIVPEVSYFCHIVLGNFMDTETLKIV